MSLRYHVRNACEKLPSLYCTISRTQLKMRGWGIDRPVQDGTELVIDGFPRSANSFATKAFREAQGRKIMIGNHSHSRANIIEGVRRGLPVLLLIRLPDDAIVGLAGSRTQQVMQDPEVERAFMKLATRRYIDFYEPLMPYRDHILVAEFKAVITNYTTVLKRLNKQFNKDFIVFEHTPENQQAIFSQGGEYLSPSQKRDAFKKSLREFFEPEAPLSVKAREVYHAFLDHPNVMTAE